MFERLIQFAIEQRLVVMLAVLLMAAVGIHSYQQLPIDAVPPRPATHRLRPSSASPSPSRRPWPACLA
jgi:Cu/Ag efflux pump CusA